MMPESAGKSDILQAGPATAAVCPADLHRPANVDDRESWSRFYPGYKGSGENTGGFSRHPRPKNLNIIAVKQSNLQSSPVGYATCLTLNERAWSSLTWRHPGRNHRAGYPRLILHYGVAHNS
jgi:hypothetical protein